MCPKIDPYEKSKMLTKRYRKLKQLLKLVYGYDTFRSKQYEIINRILGGEDVCAIMPTGMGKSLTFQIPALYLKQTAIIISPLISLMNDQQIMLEELGITSCCYNANTQNKPKVLGDILKGKYQFVYITPESLVKMQEFLVKLQAGTGISLVAIDEAHCISAYGFDFRKAYREITFLKKALPETPILAVTATATRDVGEDICRVLGFKHTKPIITSFDRPNLFLDARIKSSKNGMVSDIVPIINKHKGEAIIIYCISRKETEKIAELLKIRRIKCGVYHAGLAPEVKDKAHNDFLSGKLNIISATIAFGMGINKADVRAVVHYGCPKNIEGYYQEIGRAGRDGEKAFCYTFFGKQDFVMQESFIMGGNDETYRAIQLRKLEQMKQYMTTRQCRRRLMLEYFDEEAPNNCNFCDNCCKTHKGTEEVERVEQNVKCEAKMLVDLVETFSVRNQRFGITVYINILRGSKNKAITAIMRKANSYGKGKHRSVEWWKELTENLVQQGFLQQVLLQSGRFPMKVVSATRNGVTWASMADLGEFMEGLNVPQLAPIRMATDI